MSLSCWGSQANGNSLEANGIISIPAPSLFRPALRLFRPALSSFCGALDLILIGSSQLRAAKERESQQEMNRYVICICINYHSVQWSIFVHDGIAGRKSICGMHYDLSHKSRATMIIHSSFWALLEWRLPTRPAQLLCSNWLATQYEKRDNDFVPKMKLWIKACLQHAFIRCFQNRIRCVISTVLEITKNDSSQFLHKKWCYRIHFWWFPRRIKSVDT